MDPNNYYKINPNGIRDILLSNNFSDVKKFIDELDVSVKLKLLAKFKILGDTKIDIVKQIRWFKTLSDLRVSNKQVYEIKLNKIRIIGFFIENDFVCIHSYLKQSQRMPKNIKDTVIKRIKFEMNNLGY